MRPLGVALFAATFVAAWAQAAISVVSDSQFSVSVVDPPVTLQLGAAGSTSSFFSPFTLSANATSVSGTVLGRAGADWYANDVVRVVNQRASSQSVTLTAVQLSNAQLDLFLWHLYNGSTLVGTMDMEAAGPSLTFTLPASTSYRLDLRLDLAEGAGNDNAPTSFSLGLRVGTGGITVTHSSGPSLSTGIVEVPLRPLISGSSGGANSTNATASVNIPTLIQSTQNVFYLNNTGAATWYVKLASTSTSSLSDVATTYVGVNDGTTSTDHIGISAGSLIQPSGSYQALAAGSTNRIYVTGLEGVLFNGATLDFDLYASPTSGGESYLVSKARLTLT